MARDAGVERGHAHGEHLGIEGVDAAHLGGQLILANSQHAAAVLGIHQQCRGGQEDDHDDQRDRQRRVQGDARDALGPVQHELFAADVQIQVQVVKDQSYRLANAQGRDAEIVAFQAKGDLAEGRAEDHGRETGHDQRQPIRQAEAHRAEDRNIRADADKARMAERKHSGIARQDGKAQHDQQRITGLDQDAFDIIPANHVRSSLRLVFHGLAHEAGGLDDQNEDQ